MDEPKELAEIVRFHRKRAGLTQIGLARLAGTGKSAVFDLEKGKESVQLDTILKVLHVLNVKLRFQGPLMDELERGGTT